MHIGLESAYHPQTVRILVGTLVSSLARDPCKHAPCRRVYRAVVDNRWLVACTVGIEQRLMLLIAKGKLSEVTISDNIMKVF